MLRRIGIKRVALVLMSFGYLGLGVDALIGHQLSGSGIEEGPQYVPLLFGPLAFLSLLSGGALRLSPAALAWLTRLVGGASAVIGVAGVALHLGPILRDLADEELTAGALAGALGSGPPLLAPVAFSAAGLLVLALGARSLRIELAETAISSEPTPLASAAPAQTSSDRAA